MNKLAIIPFLLFLLFLTQNSKNTENLKNSNNQNKIDERLYEEIELIKKKQQIIHLHAFARKIRYLESRNDHQIINQIGCMGWYQFKLSTLEGLNIYVSNIEFLQDTSIQNIALIRYIKYNYRILENYIKKYNQTTIDGINVTTSGILGGGQFGAGYVIEFFNQTGEYPVADINGTKTSEYIEKLSGYDIPDVMTLPDDILNLEI